MDLVFERPPSQKKKKAKRRQISLSSKGPLMETALFSAASLFHGDDDSDDGRDEMEVGAEGKEEALEYVERAHEFPGMVRFHDPCLIFSEIGRAWNSNYYLGYPKGSSYDPVQ